MLKYKWTLINVKTKQDIDSMIHLFIKIKPDYAAFDTETTGLHIIQDKPFLFQFGFIHPTDKVGWSYTVELDKDIRLATYFIKVAYSLCKDVKLLVGHNIKFDLHMMTNVGLPYPYDNLSDTMFYIRYGHDALHTPEGGPPLSLKDYASRYIDRNAKYHEKLLKKERTDLAKTYNAKLKNRLHATLKQIKEWFSDCTFEVSDLPVSIQSEYINWLQDDIPIYLRQKITSLVESDMIRYDTLNRENLLRYAGYDVVYTLETLLQLIPSVQGRHNEWAVELESKLIKPLYEMERVGFDVDTAYLENCRVDMRAYIRQRRQILYDLAGYKIDIGQHAKILQHLQDHYDLDISSTGNEVLDRIKNQFDLDSEAKAFINVLQELRTLEKWYSAYVLRFQRDLKLSGNSRIYTTINQVGTVSGRVTSDFQQFPRNGIAKVNGEPLFNPRQIVKASTGTVYLDYSQIELRFQAFYTILVGHADLNLCRAYMPYKCHDKTTDVQFDYKNPEHIRNAYNGEWLYNENNEQWVATDVHGATTTAATGLTPSDEGFHEARYSIGKRTNFAKNYGAKLGKIRQMFPDKTEEEVKRIDEAYYTAFPGVKEYHTYCYIRAATTAYTENLFGVRYYNVSGHKLINMLVQGSAAFYLKTRILALYEYSKKHNIKTRWQMQIHDELSWEYNPEDDPEIFFEFKRIMEQWDDTFIPIVADMEATKTTWADKIEIENIDELKEILNG